jgi:hypothetical protein
MKRFLLTAAVFAASLTVASIAQANGGHNGSGHHGSSGSHREYKPSERFGYSKYGMKSFSWSHYRWSDYYRRYCYWTPSYGWYFYEPIHACYLPVSCYREVYPDAPTFSASVPTVNQQTTVVNVPAGPALRASGPPPIPTVATAPAAVQQTKVGAGLP